MPVYFSTLDDAWGNHNNFPIEKKKRKDKSSDDTNKDPLCELYGKRYSKVSKPYSSNDDFENNFAEYDKNPYNKNMINKNTNQNRQEYYPIELDEYSSFASVKAIENADDEDYLLNALDKVNKTDKNFKEDEEENNEGICENEIDNPSNSKNKIKTSTDNNEIINDDNYLDLGLFATSGIILIFMMEKILQLGIMMKN
jgi:hypothetical protein